MNSKTYLTIAYKRNYASQKLILNKNWWKNKDREKWGFNRSVKNTKQIYNVDVSKIRGYVCKGIGRNVLKIFLL